MHNFVISISSEEEAPCGMGSRASWFLYYKWRTPAEQPSMVFYPVDEEKYPNVQAGDVLWFIVDKAPLGGVTVTHTMDDPSSGKVELWYDTATIRPHPWGDTDITAHVDPKTQEVPERFFQ